MCNCRRVCGMMVICVNKYCTAIYAFGVTDAKRLTNICKD